LGDQASLSGEARRSYVFPSSLVNLAFSLSQHLADFISMAIGVPLCLVVVFCAFVFFWWFLFWIHSGLLVGVFAVVLGCSFSKRDKEGGEKKREGFRRAVIFHFIAKRPNF
jgi:drug/metabolite transporter (DMT)-like permease